jgi:hypothetical protein
VCFLIAYLSYLKHAYLWQLQNARSPQESDDEMNNSESIRSERSAA